MFKGRKMKKLKWKKRSLAFFAGIFCVTAMITGCQAKSEEEMQTESSSIRGIEKLNIVCTAYPQYDWVMQILGKDQEYAEVTYLLKNGVDIHSYQPSVEDMIKISDSDLLIYIGGESEQWVEDALKNSTNENQKTINLIESLGERVKEEEIVEGMQEEKKNSHEEIEYDEHVWLSLKNAEIICEKIIETLEELDGENQEIYKKNGAVYLEQIEELDKQYQQMIEQSSLKTFLFADRFPFRYLVEDYGLEYYAAFAGCSAETEASFETITFLAQKIDELDLPVVYQIETSDDSLAQTVVRNTTRKNQSILTLDSMQSVKEQEISDGTTYLSIMRSNLELLKIGLN